MIPVFDTPFRRGKTYLAMDLLKHFSGSSEATGNYCDIELICRDGRRLKSCRGILAARSNYFSSLLFSGFKEQQQVVVNVDLDSTSLSSVLEYFMSGMFTYEQEPTIEAAQEIVKLRNAADYVDCQPMYYDCIFILNSKLRLNPDLTFLILEATINDQRSSHLSLIKEAIAGLRSCQQEISESNVFKQITCLSKKGLHALFEEERKEENKNETSPERTKFIRLNNISTEKWFNIIKWWFKNHYSKSNPPLKPECMFELTGKLDYKDLSLSFICDTVEPSGLMSFRNLSNAFKYHAENNARSLEQYVKELSQQSMELGAELSQLKQEHDTQTARLKTLKDVLQREKLYYAVEHLLESP